MNQRTATILDNSELFSVTCAMPQIKAGSFALIMEMEELKRGEEQHLHLYDVFNDPGTIVDGGDEKHYERCSEACEEDPHMYGDDDYGWEEEPRSKSSRASRVFHSLRTASSSFGHGPQESIASSMKKKRSMVTEYLDNKLQRKTSSTSSTSSTFSIASTREAFILRVASVKARFVSVARKE